MVRRDSMDAAREDAEDPQSNLGAENADEQIEDLSHWVEGREGAPLLEGGKTSKSSFAWGKSLSGNFEGFQRKVKILSRRVCYGGFRDE